ncbi:MAG: DUF1795 domain-containing protein [Methanosphaera stadtmanae]|nr:DUF1795 domain-containing protein [Methanosphaera stadtmanae]
MKLNKILVALLIVGMLSCGLSAVFAEEGTLSDGTKVTIPDGFSVLDTGSGIFTLVTEDQQNVITVMDEDVTTDAEKAKQDQVENGAEFIDDKTVTIGDTEVIAQHFTKSGFNFYGYLFKAGDKDYIVTYTSPDEIDVEDASTPVNQIISSLVGTTE